MIKKIIKYHHILRFFLSNFVYTFCNTNYNFQCYLLKSISLKTCSGKFPKILLKIYFWRHRTRTYLSLSLSHRHITSTDRTYTPLRIAHMNFYCYFSSILIVVQIGRVLCVGRSTLQTQTRKCFGFDDVKRLTVMRCCAFV